MKRVLLCCEFYAPSVGGVQEVMRQIAERLALNGLDVTVATSPHPDRAMDTTRNGVRVLSFPISGNQARGMTGSLAKYRAFIEHGGFDGILIKAAQQWTFDAAVDILPHFGGRKLFIPCGFSGLSDPNYASYYQCMPKWLRLFDGLIFYSEDYQDVAFARLHGLETLHFIPNGVDEREFADRNDHAVRNRLGIAPDHDLLLSVGSQIAAKGHWEILRAFKKARLPRPATLVLNGNEPGSGVTTLLKRTLKHALSRRWPLSWEARWQRRDSGRKRVMITDLPRNDLVDLYKAADLFVLASHVEYSPLVLFEAAAAGTAFLSTPVGNSREIAAWTGAGHVMRRLKVHGAAVSIDALAAEMEVILSNPTRLVAMGEAGRQSIFSKGFTWNRIVERYMQLLTEV
jgi:L-malate glycosyltransferase